MREQNTPTAARLPELTDEEACRLYDVFAFAKGSVAASMRESVAVYLSLMAGKGWVMSPHNLSEGEKP